MPPDTNNPKLTAYALGELAERERAEVEAALAESPGAQAYVDGVRRTAALLEAEFAGEVEADGDALLPLQREQLRQEADRTFAGGLLTWNWKVAGLVGAVGVAACLTTVLVPDLFSGSPSQGPADVQPVALRGDFNTDGSVNIVDAYLLARSLDDESLRAGLPPTWDLTADGAIDQADVDHLATLAVQLVETSS